MRRPETFTEAQLAGPLSPIVLAVGAAAATVVVTVGVIAGPGTVACIQRGDFPICMSETFFGGSGATIGDGEAAQEMAGADGSQEAPSTNDTPLEASETVGSQETATSVSEAVMPAFGLVRVEPDGSAVIAGSATPSGEVRIFADDDQIGTETVHASGDFAFVTDAPLPTGGVELRILDVETNRFADTSVVVVVQDDRTSEPLVIASVPGEASEILQGLDGPVAAQAGDENMPDAPEAETTPETMAVAEAEVAESEVTETRESASQPAVVAGLEGDAASQDETGDQPESAETVAVISEESEDPTQPSGEQDAASAAVEADDDEGVRVEETARAPQTTPVPQAGPDASVEQPVAAPDSTVAAGQTSVAETVVSDDAVVDDESDADVVQEETPAAGEAEPAEASASVGQPEDSPVTTAEAADVPAPGAVPSDDAPAVEPQDDGAPLSDQGDAPPSPAQVANEPDAVSESAETIETPATLSQPTVAAAPQPALTSPTIDAVEIDGDLNFFAGAGEDGLTVRLYVDNEVVGSTQVSDGRWLIEAIDVLDQESQRIRIDMLAQDGSVVGRAEVDFILELPETVNEDIVVAEQSEMEADSASPAPTSREAEAPANVSIDTPVAPAPAAPDMVEPAQTAEPVESAEPEETVEPSEVAQAPDDVESAETDEPAIPTLVGVSDGNRTATGLAIIRQGDNLWTIARRVYGEGIRYTQIFEANTDQIRNPDLIYPGQVFDLPGTDEVIGETDDDGNASQ